VTAGRVFTVSELQATVRDTLEADFHDVAVDGEISRPTLPRSGHCYFTLKDEGATLSAVMWRSTVQRLRFEVEDGMAVRARGHLTVYPPSGRYQMIVQALEPRGAGPLQVAFEQLRRRLESEGLFDPARKVALPPFPRRVALGTSPTGAAVRDLIRVAHRRWPALELVIVPVRVQGEGAAAEIAAAIGLADGLGFDVLVVGRGGGSLEDLWAFNEEVVARAVAAAATPVVSAVGHETDVTISDLVADLRAATPSQAAELVAPSRDEQEGVVAGLARRLSHALRRAVDERAERLGRVVAARALRDPLAVVRDREQALDDRARRLARAGSSAIRLQRLRLEAAAGRLEALSPLSVLARGYSVTLKEGRVLRRAADARPGDLVETRLHEGRLRAEVRDIEP